MKKRKTGKAVKISAVVFLILVIAALCIWYLWHSFKRLDYFNIREVITGQPVTADLSYLKGRNIFEVDLRSQAQHLYALYPEYSNIRLVRILPNRLFVDFKQRQPVALIRLYKYFSVDNECVLFDAPVSSGVLELPVIAGLETKILGPRVGKRFAIRELALALNIIRAVQSHRALSLWKIKKIDVASPASASFFIALPFKKPALLLSTTSREPEPLEVKVGDQDTMDKVDILTNLLIQLKNEWINIKYIDLRFKEPAVKFKEKNAKK